MSAKPGSDRIKWFFVLPLFLFVLAWNVFPLFWALGLSFYDFSVVKSAKLTFVGLGNYIDMFTTPYYWERFRTTWIYTASAVSLEAVIGLLLGSLFNQELKGKRIMLTLVMAPMIISPVATGIFWRFLYEPTWGFFNYVLYTLFNVRIGFITEAVYALPSVVLVDVWMWSPFMMMMTLAGLQAVPRSLLEAAEIDRTPWWRKFRYIIFPVIRPLLVLALLLRTIDAFRIFDIIFVMTKGGPGTATEVISMTTYRTGFAFFYTGLGSALAIVCLIISIIMTVLYLRMLRRVEVA